MLNAKATLTPVGLSDQGCKGGRDQLTPSQNTGDAACRDHSPWNSDAGICGLLADMQSRIKSA